MKKNIAFSVIGILFLAVASGFLFKEPQRQPSNQLLIENKNIQILQSIPLVKNLEVAEPDEASIANDMIQIFDRFADRNAVNGKRNRGTHAKGKCFNGQLDIFNEAELKANYKFNDGFISRLKKGLWKWSGQYPATLRFANADGMGRKQSDAADDVRGFSFSVNGPSNIRNYAGNNRQDFMMNSTPGFASGEVHEFFEVVKMANIAVYKDFDFLPNVFYVPAATKDLALIAMGNKMGGHVKGYAQTEYWGNLPYTHGRDDKGLFSEVVKYKATPCNGQGTQKLSTQTNLDANYLQNEIVDEAKKGEVCMLIQVQFFDITKMQQNSDWIKSGWSLSEWVENGGLEWSESLMPFYTVGKISVPAGGNNEVSCDDKYINTRLNSNEDNQPMGSIARVRTLVEENSHARRTGQ